MFEGLTILGTEVSMDGRQLKVHVFCA